MRAGGGGGFVPLAINLIDCAGAEPSGLLTLFEQSLGIHESYTSPNWRDLILLEQYMYHILLEFYLNFMFKIKLKGFKNQIHFCKIYKIYFRIFQVLFYFTYLLVGGGV